MSLPPSGSTTPARDCKADLAARQDEALAAFARARAVAEAAATASTVSREARLDAARRLEVVRRQHAALVARADARLAAGHALLATPRTRVVVVHPDPWFTDRVCDALTRQGLDVVARLDNGADGVGVAVAEQPDLLLLGDPVPMMTGQGVVAEVLRFSPRTFVAVQAADPRARESLIACGVGSVFGRSVPPADVAAGLADALTARRAVQPAG